MTTFVTCRRGCVHWGNRGAAGLLVYRYLTSGEVQMLLGLRAEQCDHPLTWATIGGAIENGESARQAMEREVMEEIGLNIREFLWPVGEVIDDHGGWSYITFVADPRKHFEISDLKLDTNEIKKVEWVTRKDLASRNLHPNFAAFVKDKLDIWVPPDVDPSVVHLYILNYGSGPMEI
ncbi:NUDIX hydrolase domain-like protein [Daldinia vernicosa]|uniref:NUDIX hydrolase domain-like protein n=1 Tax=Daldinia vernicosa TaxID=114800 RepID=UPI002007350F|nr:NUDIX hydrolase domain-like protein [Daldinia vernicosa]KAI0854320.1 NUDIX hydrolase domain-like protein [Daldinia vernicosa]